MEKVDSSVVNMWDAYIKKLGKEGRGEDLTYEAWSFCDNEADANELARLVLEGTKRATASLYKSYEVEDEELPKVGDYSIITNWDGLAQCIIECSRVSILPFKEITEEHARREGEGDKSLRYWRQGHIQFFSRECKDMGLEFDEDMLVVFEEFDVVYR